MKKLIAALLVVVMAVSSLATAVSATNDTAPSFDEKNVVATLFDSSVTDYSDWYGNDGYSYELTTIDGITVLQHCTWSSGSVTFKRSFDVDWSEHDYANIKIVAYVYIEIEGEDAADIVDEGLVQKGKFEIRCVDSAGTTSNRYIADPSDGLVLHTGWNAIELTLDDMPIQSADSASTQETGYTTTNEFCFYLTCNSPIELTMSLASAYIIDTAYDNTAAETEETTTEEETTEATEETTEAAEETTEATEETTEATEETTAAESTSGSGTGTADDVTITSFAEASTGTLEFSNDFSLTYTFTNTSTGSNNWDNFIVEVFNSDGVYTTVRADNYGWLANQTDTADTITFGEGLDDDGWTAWREAMAAGSECTVTVVKEGTTVTITSVCGGATFTATAVVSEFADADLTVHLTGENVNLTSVAYTYTTASGTETAPQTGFSFVVLGVVALASGTAVVATKKKKS